METLADCTCLILRQAARAVTEMYDQALKPCGLGVTQFALLGAVARRGPAGVTELAKALAIDRTTLSRNLRPLVDRGLLQAVGSADRRQRRIALTSRGRDRLARAG